MLGLLTGGLLHVLRPRSVTPRGLLARLVGIVLIVTGLGTVGWTVRTVGDGTVEQPTELVTAGPYAASRNPVYVAWTVLYGGVSLAANTIWPPPLPAVVVATHVTVRREERRLDAAFGEEYRDYRDDVPRYLLPDELAGVDAVVFTGRSPGAPSRIDRGLRAEATRDPASYGGHRPGSRGSGTSRSVRLTASDP